ncbi:MAG: hypothetical protein R3B70_20555 [Polyangiaceae bacterium]
MRYGLRYGFAFLSIFTAIFVNACDGDGGDGPGASAVSEACQKYCASALAEPCGDNQLTVSQCEAQCGYFAGQLLGVCEAEYVDAFECLAAGGFECKGYDTDQDGVDDQFVPSPLDPCIEAQTAQITCEQTAGCKRFCKEAEDQGCGDGCLEACEGRAAELDDNGFMCSYGYQSLMACSARTGVKCSGDKPKPNLQCVDGAFAVAECQNGDSDMCKVYCGGSTEVGCAKPDCDADCASRASDPTCGNEWNSLLDCLLFFGDAVCQDNLLVPDPNGICDSDRESYLDCKGGSF